MVRVEVAKTRRQGGGRACRSLTLFLVAGCLAGPAAAADDPFLAALVGTWTGRGQMIQTQDGKPERVFCKVTNTLSADGASLSQEGRCSLASNSGPISGTITRTGDGTYAGTLASLASKAPAKLDGALAVMTKDAEGRIVPAERATKPDDKIQALRMNAVYIDRISNGEVQSVNVIALQPGGGYTLLATRTNAATGESYTSSRIDFAAN